MKRIAFAVVLAVPLAASLPASSFAQAATSPASPLAASTAPDASVAKPAVPPAAKATPPATSAPSATPAPAAPPAPPASAGAASPAAPAEAPPPKSSTAAAAASPPAITLAEKALAVKAGHYRLDPGEGKITWSVNHRGFSTYVGQFGSVAADLVIDPKAVGKTTLTATVDVTSLGTLNARLDDTLKGEDWFDSKTFPQASFKATAVTVTGPQTARIDGDLTLRGKTAPIVISATFNNAGVDPVDKQYTVGFDAAAIIRRSAFGISKDVPFVGDNVTLRLEGEFKPVAQP